MALVTGHGLKTVEALSGTVGPTVTIAPTLEAFDARRRPRPAAVVTGATPPRPA